MEKRLFPSLSKIQKPTMFFVIALAMLGAVGVMTTMMTTATTADAAPQNEGCLLTSSLKLLVCPPPRVEDGGSVCNLGANGPDGCRNIGPN
jgi:hypothetical protein